MAWQWGKLHLIEPRCLSSGRRLRICLAVYTKTENPASAPLWEAAPCWYNSVYMGQTISPSILHSTDVCRIGLKRTSSLNKTIKHDGGRFMSKWIRDALKLHLLIAFTIATDATFASVVVVYKRELPPTHIHSSTAERNPSSKPATYKGFTF